MNFRRIFALATVALLSAPLAADDMGLPDLGGGYSAAPAVGGNEQDLSKLQARIDDLMAQAKATKESADRLDGMIDRLLNSTGVRFGGEAVVHSIALGVFQTKGNSTIPVGGSSFTVPGASSTLTTPKRVWPSIGYLDFRITARPRPELSGEVVYRMEKVFGGYWGSLDISGVRWFNLHGDTAIGFDFGQFKYKHTPLTVWAPEDAYPFEIEALAAKRKVGMEQVYLGDNKWPLQGGRIDSTVVFGGAIDLELEAIGVRTAIAGTKNTSLPFAVIFPYDQYLVGGTAALKLDKSDVFRQGFSYFELIESKDTSITPPTSPQLRSNVVGADLTLNMGSHVSLRVEGANSNYTHDYGGRYVSWTTGGAGDVELALKGSHHDIKLHALYVDPLFINYAAQTRTNAPGYDSFGDVPTGNNLLDPHEGDYGLTNVTNLFFTRYNPVIFGTRQGVQLTSGGDIAQRGALLIPAGLRNRSLPEGWATPNRAGGGLDAQLSFIDGGLKFRGLGGMYLEPTQAYYVASNVGNRAYTTGGAGMTVDLGPMLGLPLALSGGWNMENVLATNVVAYTVQTGNVNLHWQVLKGFHLIEGFQQICANGKDYEYNNLGVNGALLFTVDTVITTMASGAVWELSKASDLSFTYDHVDFWNPTGGPSIGYEEFEARLAMRF